MSNIQFIILIGSIFICTSLAASGGGYSFIAQIIGGFLVGIGLAMWLFNLS